MPETGHIRECLQIKNESSVQVLLVFLILVSSGCRRQAWYEGVKEGSRNNCRSQHPSDIEVCLEKLNKKTYEEYEKEVSGQKWVIASQTVFT
ncbi:MAG: hypothetical protein ACAH05_08170 [Methylophilus sp.]